MYSQTLLFPPTTHHSTFPRGSLSESLLLHFTLTYFSIPYKLFKMDKIKEVSLPGPLAG